MRGACIILLALSSPAIVNAEVRPRSQGSVVSPLLGAPASFDPVQVRTHSDAALVALMFDTLYRHTADGVAPHLAAEMPRVSEDQRTVWVPLRTGVLFHGGAVLSAKDVAKSLERAKATEARWLLADMVAVKAKGGEVEISFRVAAEDPALLLSLPQTAVTRDGKRPKFNDVDGTGPFRLRAFIRSRRTIKLERFEHHFAGPPFLDALTLRWYDAPDAEARAYDAGDTHVSFRGAVAFAGHAPKFATDSTESTASVLVYVGFGTRRSLLAHHGFRAAVSESLNRRAFRNLGSGEKVVPVSFPLRDPETAPIVRSARVGDARLSLDRALKESGRASVRGVTLEIMYDLSRADDREIAEKVSAALFRLRLRTKIVGLSSLEYAEAVRTGRCDLFVGQLAQTAEAPYLQLAAAFAAGRQSRVAKETVRAGANGVAAGKRRFAAELPLVPLFFRGVQAHHWSNVRGLAFDRAARVEYPDLYFLGDAESPAGR